MTLEQMDALIGFKKPASKTADWIVNTYLPNSPVSYRLSIEHAIATAIIESMHGNTAPALSVDAGLAAAEIAALAAECAMYNRTPTQQEIVAIIEKNRKP